MLPGQLAPNDIRSPGSEQAPIKIKTHSLSKGGKGRLQYFGVRVEYSGVQAEYVKYGGVLESRLFPLALYITLNFLHIFFL